MADNEVGILVNVVAKGQADLKAVDDGLAKMATTTKAQATTLKELNPLLNAMGLGFLGAATGVGVAVGALALLSKASDNYFSGALSFGATTNNLTTSLFTLGETYAQVNDWANKLSLTQGEVEESMSTFDRVTHDTGVSLSFLNRAAEIHNATGMSMKDVTNGMAAAYTQFGQVVDKNTKGFMPAGVDAMNQYIDNMLALKSSAGKTRASAGTFMGRIGETAGGLGLALLSPPPEGEPPKSAAEAGAGVFGPGVNYSEPWAGYFKSPSYGGNIPPMPVNVNITIKGGDKISQAIADSMQVDASLQGAP